MRHKVGFANIVTNSDKLGHLQANHKSKGPFALDDDDPF